MLVVDIKHNLKLVKFLVVFYRPVARIYSKWGGDGDSMTPKSGRFIDLIPVTKVQSVPFG